ncbi:head GIN domain-containing protein [Ichthyenterobacterium magnum]|uniref:Putative autotransporter adhesin-like protein n=1 Tax=Ichthyenterobacterium magnum TaxID=1230530 RepID=A0A420DGP3_9FLAO|nr:head GIN domain-containing protein [Ichthyenterobacterium magnum]RKE92258.1 putative autotransporter adhesin-like protein [Ichthyenterobacterium magnum]
MTTLTKLIVATVISLLLFSCNFDFNFGVKGNGNVKTIERTLEGNFSQIEVSRGIDVYLTQSDTQSLEVQADENLHEIIITEIENDVLKIYAEDNISYASARKVMLSFKNVTHITSTSGSDVYSTNTIVADKLTLNTTSGSDMELDINTNIVDCKSTSGSDLKLSGKTNTIFAEATSGSDLKAGNLKANICNASATSGADITVNTKEKLHARASSGGDIRYYGNPTSVSKKDSSSGTIKQQ